MFLQIKECAAQNMEEVDQPGSPVRLFPWAQCNQIESDSENNFTD